jgi:protein-tyrosine phosphatase
MMSLSTTISTVALPGLLLGCIFLAGACSGAGTNLVKPGLSLGIESVPNLRDLGGYATGDGATVAGRLVYRSNQLVGVTATDMQKLAALGLKNDFDLRTKAEVDLHQDEVPPGVNVVKLDVLSGMADSGAANLEVLLGNPTAANAALGGGKAQANFKTTYRNFITLPSASAAFRTLYLALGNPAQLPALFHCTTGKDRTGWAAAAFLTLLGVPRETVMADYLRSNDYILPKYKETIDKFIAGGGEPAIPPAILGVQAAYLESAFDEMTKQYGTIQNYFEKALGIDAAGQKALLDLYLAPR